VAATVPDVSPELAEEGPDVVDDAKEAPGDDSTVVGESTPEAADEVLPLPATEVGPAESTEESPPLADPPIESTDSIVPDQTEEDNSESVASPDNAEPQVATESVPEVAAEIPEETGASDPPHSDPLSDLAGDESGQGTILQGESSGIVAEVGSAEPSEVSPEAADPTPLESPAIIPDQPDADPDSPPVASPDNADPPQVATDSVPEVAAEIAKESGASDVPDSDPISSPPGDESAQISPPIEISETDIGAPKDVATCDQSPSPESHPESSGDSPAPDIPRTDLAPETPPDANAGAIEPPSPNPDVTDSHNPTPLSDMFPDAPVKPRVFAPVSPKRGEPKKRVLPKRRPSPPKRVLVRSPVKPPPEPVTPVEASERLIAAFSPPRQPSPLAEQVLALPVDKSDFHAISPLEEEPPLLFAVSDVEEDDSA
jgi:hypothetical protein